MAELPGILNWALAGLKIWQEEGLVEPECVKAGVEEYRSESDQLGQFVGECCTFRHENRVRPSQLYQKYTEWCESRREKPKSMIAFGRALLEGYAVTKADIQGSMYYKGIGEKENERGDFELKSPLSPKQNAPKSTTEFLSKRDEPSFSRTFQKGHPRCAI